MKFLVEQDQTNGSIQAKGEIQLVSRQAGNGKRWYNICRPRKRGDVMRSCAFQACSSFARIATTLEISIHGRHVTQRLHTAATASIARFASSNESESRVSVALAVILTVTCTRAAPSNAVGASHVISDTSPGASGHPAGWLRPWNSCSRTGEISWNTKHANALSRRASC